jgi:Phosphotransferase enzyme family
VTGNIVQTDVLEHPAVKAWIRLQPDCLEPKSIEILDKQKRTWLSFQSERLEFEIIESLGERTLVYRLKGVGPGGSAVIAKQCEQVAGITERTIYEEILVRLPVPTPRYYGLVEEPDGEFCWLFLDDVGTEQCSPHISEHRALAARWLGLMHTSAACVATRTRLPDRGPDHYLKHLQVARDRIQRTKIKSAALRPDDLAVLESLVSRFDVLESCWSKVERFCDSIPKTLVHGDFQGWNMRIRHDQTGRTLLPFDWEMSGWGVPTDLAQGTKQQVDLAIYWSIVRQFWPHLDVRDMERMANLGKIFWELATISWKSCPLEYDLLGYDTVKSFVLTIKSCEGRLADAIRATIRED